MPWIIQSVRPEDEIHISSLGKSYWLKNETYRFELDFLYYVPRAIKRHIIYTTTPDKTQDAIKRAIRDNGRELFELSVEDHSVLSDYFKGDIPSGIKVNNRKRSLPLIDGTLRVIPIAPKVKVLMKPADVSSTSRKRAISQEIGQEACLHVPFFTTCDNSADLESVKTALQKAVDEIYAEIDSYKKTDNARAETLSSTLNKQRDIIENLASEIQTTAILSAQIAQAIAVNAAQIADGDFQAHSQINYLKRVTNTLLKYSNALASSDPRAVVAQPALTELFKGYLTALNALTNSSYLPIVSGGSRFTWKEQILPAQSIQNVTEPPCMDLQTCGSFPQRISRIKPAPVFKAVFSCSCEGTSAGAYCAAPAQIKTETTDNWIYGPFHKNHLGIYTVIVNTQNDGQQYSNAMQPIVQSKGTSPSASVAMSYINTNAYCVQFMGYKMFSSVPNPYVTNPPSILNSYQNVLPNSDCDALRLVDTDAPAQGVPTEIFSLYAESEGVVIPFYSNCDKQPLIDEINLVQPGNTLVSTIDYICSNNWTRSLENPSDSVCNTVPKSIPNADVFSRHWITPNCYINLEPGWLELDYHIAPNLEVIENIPRGYRLNQFTINLEGELSSSIEFLYTDSWLPVYSVKKVSQNTIITDEISVLRDSKVLFYLDHESVIDESDYFFGLGINGRDCIQQSDIYDYNLLNCFFQNDNTLYTPNDYLNGIISTSGISRFNKKFNFVFFDDVEPYSFVLTPKNTSDYSYSLELDEMQCPRLISQSSQSNQCLIKLSFSAAVPVVAKPVDTINYSSINVNFVNYTAQFPIGLTDWKISANGIDCMILTCQQTLSVSTVTVKIPNVQLISQADLALEAQMNLYINNTLTERIAKMVEVQSSVNTIYQNIENLKLNLSKIDFNVSAIYTYADFTDLRKQVDSIINGITDDPADTTDESGRSCNGPWNNFVCWLQDFAGVLITVAIVAVLVVVGYVVFVKFGVAQKICGDKGKVEQIEMQAAKQ